MKRVLVVVLSLFGLSVLPACRRQTEPPPRFMALKGVHGIPVRVFGRAGNPAILASVPPDAEGTAGQPVGEAKETTPTAPTIQIDDSTAEGIAKAVADISAAGAINRLPEVLVPAQQDLAREALQVYRPVLEAKEELRRALDAKFPGHAIQLGTTSFAPTLAGLTVVSVEVDANKPDEATATYGQPSGGQVKMRLLRVEEHWRVELPGEFSAEELKMGTPIMTGMAEGFRAVAARIENGEIANQAAAEQALSQVVMKAMGAAMAAGQGKPTVEPAPEAKAPEPRNTPSPEAAPTPAKPKVREREEVDEVYSGPGMLRAH